MIIKTICIGYKDYIISVFNTLKYSILLSILIFIVGIVVSIVNLFEINNLIEAIIKNLFANFTNSGGIELFFKLFVQNAKAALYIILSGVIFSIFPVVATLLNGAMIGYILVNLDSYSTLSLAEGILYMVPHGIFEIPAIILAISLGINLGLWPYQDQKVAYIKSTMLRSAQSYLLIIVPFLLMAGAIEAYNIEQLRQ